MHRASALITPPNAAVVSLDDAKAQLKITDDSQDDDIQGLIDACAQQLDPAFNGWLGRALRPQTWELRLDRFPEVIELPFPPLVEMVSLTYTDFSGDDQTLALSEDYRVFGDDGLGSASLRPAYGRHWPSVRVDLESVRIRYSCGYAPADEGVSDALPAGIKKSLLLMIQGLYNLGSRNVFLTTDTVIGVSSTSYSVSPAAVAVMQDVAESLLSIYRVWR